MNDAGEENGNNRHQHVKVVGNSATHVVSNIRHQQRCSHGNLHDSIRMDEKTNLS